MSYITCKDLVLGYNGNAISKKMNFSIDKGDYLFILGENGIGKSTLIKTFLGLTPAVSGAISLGDEFTKNDIAYLPQRTDAQKDFPATVFEIVLSGALLGKKRRLFVHSEDKEKAKELLKRFEIYDLKDRCFADLSGGQQQKVLLSRALIADRKVIVLDEPVTGLDPMAQQEMYQFIANLNKEGISIVMISHDMNAINYASYVLHMSHKGNFYGSVEEYKNSKYWTIYNLEQEDEDAVQ